MYTIFYLYFVPYGAMGNPFLKLAVITAIAGKIKINPPYSIVELLTIISYNGK